MPFRFQPGDRLTEVYDAESGTFAKVETQSLHAHAGDDEFLRVFMSMTKRAVPTKAVQSQDTGTVLENYWKDIKLFLQKHLLGKDTCRSSLDCADNGDCVDNECLADALASQAESLYAQCQKNSELLKPIDKARCLADLERSKMHTCGSSFVPENEADNAPVGTTDSVDTARKRFVRKGLCQEKLRYCLATNRWFADEQSLELRDGKWVRKETAAAQDSVFDDARKLGPSECEARFQRCQQDPDLACGFNNGETLQQRKTRFRENLLKYDKVVTDNGEQVSQYSQCPSIDRKFYATCAECTKVIDCEAGHTCRAGKCERDTVGCTKPMGPDEITEKSKEQMCRHITAFDMKHFLSKNPQYRKKCTASELAMKYLRTCQDENERSHCTSESAPPGERDSLFSSEVQKLMSCGFDKLVPDGEETEEGFTRRQTAFVNLLRWNNRYMVCTRQNLIEKFAATCGATSDEALQKGQDTWLRAMRQDPKFCLRSVETAKVCAYLGSKKAQESTQQYFDSLRNSLDGPSLWQQAQALIRTSDEVVDSTSPDQSVVQSNNFNDSIAQAYVQTASALRDAFPGNQATSASDDLIDMDPITLSNEPVRNNGPSDSIDEPPPSYHSLFPDGPPPPSPPPPYSAS